MVETITVSVPEGTRIRLKTAGLSPSKLFVEAVANALKTGVHPAPIKEFKAPAEALELPAPIQRAIKDLQSLSPNLGEKRMRKHVLLYARELGLRGFQVSAEELELRAFPGGLKLAVGLIE